MNTRQINTTLLTILSGIFSGFQLLLLIAQQFIQKGLQKVISKIIQ
jgi:hypothetical protein